VHSKRRIPSLFFERNREEMMGKTKWTPVQAEKKRQRRWSPEDMPSGDGREK
jgi:hypothetical protein